MTRPAAVALIVICGIPAFASAQEPAEPDPAAGCYRIELGAWTPELVPGNARYQTPPEAFRLDTIIGENSFERGKPIVRPTIPHGLSPSAFWDRRIEQDSIRVTWTNGFSGVRFRLRPVGDALKGTAHAFTDVIRIGGPSNPRAPVTGWRIDCAELEGWIEEH